MIQRPVTLHGKPDSLSVRCLSGSFSSKPSNHSRLDCNYTMLIQINSVKKTQWFIRAWKMHRNCRRICIFNMEFHGISADSPSLFEISPPRTSMAPAQRTRTVPRIPSSLQIFLTRRWETYSSQCRIHPHQRNHTWYVYVTETSCYMFCTYCKEDIYQQKQLLYIKCVYIYIYLQAIQRIINSTPWPMSSFGTCSWPLTYNGMYQNQEICRKDLKRYLKLSKDDLSNLGRKLLDEQSCSQTWVGLSLIKHTCQGGFCHFVVFFLSLPPLSLSLLSFSHCISLFS